jgi:hypothetical protein
VALIKCTECGTEVSDKAPACVRCGAPVVTPKQQTEKVALWAKALIFSLFAGVVFLIINKNQEDAGREKEAEAKIQLQIAAPSLAVTAPHWSAPNDQNAFEQVRTGRFEAYKSAQNEIQASAIFNKANYETNALIDRAGPNVKNWIGVISAFRTSHGGTEVHVEIKTANGAVYGMEDDAPSGSKIYRDLSSLQNGIHVFFSGTFIPSPIDQRWERSVTERGSLGAPEFRVAFTSIGTSPAAADIASQDVSASIDQKSAPSATRQSTGPSRGYGRRVAEAVRANIAFPNAELVSGNPSAEFEVKLDPDGTILGTPRLINTSSLPEWDEAALRALQKTEKLPVDIDGLVPSALIIELRLKR